MHNSATLIDNIINNKLTYSSNSGVLFSDVSDHFPIFHQNREFTSNQTNKNQCNDSNSTVRFHRFSEVNINRFKRMIEDAHWDEDDVLFIRMTLTWRTNHSFKYSRMHLTIAFPF